MVGRFLQGIEDKISQVISDKLYYILLIIFLFGALLYFFADAIAFFVQTLFNGDIEFWTEFVRDIGIALIIAAILAMLIDRLTQDILLKKIESALEGLKSAPKFIGGAFELGIEDIFSRLNPQTKDRAQIAIKDIIKRQIDLKKGEIRLLAVAAPEYLKSTSDVGILLTERLTQTDVNCKLKILLLNEHSEWAILRSQLEYSHPTIRHIQTSIDYLKQLKDDPKLNAKIEYRQYDTPPIVFLIITEEALILEPYPVIKVNGPIGGHTPMIVVRNDSKNEIYQRWSNHFNSLWNVSDPTNVNKTYIQNINLIQ